MLYCNLISLAPRGGGGGGQAIHFPYITKGQPRTLDYQLLSKTNMLKYTCSADVVDLALATDHRDLTTLLQGQREGKEEGHRHTKEATDAYICPHKMCGYIEIARLFRFLA